MACKGASDTGSRPTGRTSIGKKRGLLEDYMGKKKRQEKNRGAEKAREEKTGAKCVRVETTIIIALVAMVVGFFVGEIANVSKGRKDPPVQVASPPRQVPGMPTLSPGNTSRILELERKLASRPGDGEAWIELGNLYFDDNQTQPAIKAYKKALELHPYNADVWTDLGVMYRRNGQPFEALAAFNRTIEIDPDHEQSRFNKGIVFMHDLDDRPNAIKALEDLLKVKPLAKTSKGESVKDMVEALKREGKE